MPAAVALLAAGGGCGSSYDGFGVGGVHAWPCRIVVECAKRRNVHVKLSARTRVGECVGVRVICVFALSTPFRRFVTSARLSFSRRENPRLPAALLALYICCCAVGGDPSCVRAAACIHVGAERLFQERREQDGE
eukprot:5064206-Pleurochrysis_carterae.AAC.2